MNPAPRGLWCLAVAYHLEGGFPVATRQMTAQEMHALVLQQLVNELSSRYDRALTPLYPGVLVRVLPKEQERHGIVLPDAQQNKPTAEGIVLVTYEPKELEIPDGNGGTYLKRCDVQIGDHVLFHAMHGRPAGWMDPDDYRILREDEICAAVQHEDPVSLVEFVAQHTSCFMDGRRTSAEFAADLVEELIEQFVVVRKRQAVTLSGR
jgi:co-chaperonin GroES (HSP10)